MRKLDPKVDMVVAYTQAGYAPHEIDSELRLPKGFAHDTLVGFWVAGDYGSILNPTECNRPKPRKDVRVKPKAKKANVKFRGKEFANKRKAAAKCSA